jgi:4-aminobutyrate aminotransferase-like enzyme
MSYYTVRTWPVELERMAEIVTIAGRRAGLSEDTITGLSRDIAKAIQSGYAIGDETRRLAGDRIIEALHQAGWAGMLATELQRHTQKLTAATRREIVAELIETGVIIKDPNSRALRLIHSLFRESKPPVSQS